MRIARTVRWAALLVLCCGAAALSNDDPQGYRRYLGRYTRHVTGAAAYAFTDDSGGRKGGYIAFLDSAPRGQVELALIETPDGTRLVATSALNPVAGRHVVRISLEGTPWWAQVATTTVEKAADLDEYLAKGLATDRLDRREVMVGLSTGARFATALDGDDGDVAAHLVAALLRAQRVREFADQVPESGRGALLFLDSLPYLRSQDFDRATEGEIKALSRQPTPPAATLVRLLARMLRESGLATATT
jgi:hypothetical protein